MAHTYTNPGTYTVKLTASNSAGSNTITKSNLITVTAGAYNEVITHPSTVVSGAQYTISITGGKPNTTFTYSIDGAVASTPISLDATGKWTNTEAMGMPVGSHSATIVFQGTGHTQTFPFTVTGGYNEVINHPTSVAVGAQWTWGITGGMPNTTFTVKNMNTGITGAPETLDANGSITHTQVWTDPAGSYSYEFTFAGTGHVRTASGVATGGTSYNEIITRPSTVVAGTQFTASISGGMPNTTFTIKKDSEAPSPPITLDADGAWSLTDIAGTDVGVHTYTFTFQGTGHVQTVQATITPGTGGYNEVITHPSTAVYGQPYSYSVTGGMPNTTATVTMDSNPPDPPVTLDASGNYANTITWLAPAGTHTVHVTFQGTGHSQTFQVTSTGGQTVYNEVVNIPATVAYGANFTSTASGGMPNTSFYWIIDGVASPPPYPNLDANGAYSVTQQMTLTPGTHTVIVHFNGTSHEVTKTVNVTATVQNTLTVAGTITSGPGYNEAVTHPTAAIYGQPFTFSVSGGAPNTTFNIYVNGAFDSTRTLDGAGNFTATSSNLSPIGTYNYQFTFSATGRSVNFSAKSINAPAPGTYNEILTIPTNADYSQAWYWYVKGGKPGTSFTVLVDGVNGGTYQLDGAGNFTGYQAPYSIPPGYHTFQFNFTRV